MYWVIVSFFDNNCTIEMEIHSRLSHKGSVIYRSHGWDRSLTSSWRSRDQLQTGVSLGQSYEAIMKKHSLQFKNGYMFLYFLASTTIIRPNDSYKMPAHTIADPLCWQHLSASSQCKPVQVLLLTQGWCLCALAVNINSSPAANPAFLALKV